MSQLALLLKTVNFAAEKHINQRRKNATKSPYINHPIGVANLLADVGVRDLGVLQAALLHDTVEDTATTFAELELVFGKDVADLVREVTDDKSLPKDQRKREQVRHASQTTSRARLVKLADKLHNLSDILVVPPPWTPERIQGYFVWSREVVRALTLPLNEASIHHELLEVELNKLFVSSFTVGDRTYLTIPPGDTQSLLDGYYQSMKVAKD